MAKDKPYPPQYYNDYLHLKKILDSQHLKSDEFGAHAHDEMLHEVTLYLENIVTQLPPLFEAYWDNTDARTCRSCGSIQQPPN